MHNLEQLHEQSLKLERWLRMRVHPIAVKLLAEGDELPENAFVPSRDRGKRLNMCQAFSMAQREGMTVAMYRDDNWCFEPLVGLGIVPRTEKFLSGFHRYPDSVRDKEAAATWCQNMPYLEYGKYTGYMMAPLHTCEFWPDVVVMHINPMMTSQLMIVKNWLDGKDIMCRMSGHAGCVYAIVPAMLNGGCNVAIPCRGDRQVAMAQDDELFFSFVPEMLPDLLSGIDMLEQHNWGLPMKLFLKEELEMRPNYMIMAKDLGMKID